LLDDCNFGYIKQKTSPGKKRKGKRDKKRSLDEES
jgi:hypothetical protein